MHHLEDRLNSIYIQVQQLIQINEKLRQENLVQKNTIETLTAADKEKNLQIEHLQQQTAILKLNQLQLNEEEKKELTKKISGYIKEIDRCIHLLSQ